jgi:outer membrane murein-binding lipoprotein Lpp
MTSLYPNAAGSIVVPPVRIPPRGVVMNALQPETVRVRGLLLSMAITALPFMSAMADDHPQEVLDLVAAYDALAMKVRPLQDRVQAAESPRQDKAQFRPEGAPIRATADATSTGSKSDSESRAPERLRHKNRATTDTVDLNDRLAALEKKILAERERVMQPEFGAGLRGRNADDESGAIRFGDGQHGQRPPAKTTGLAEARKTLAQFQAELGELEREVEATVSR